MHTMATSYAIRTRGFALRRLARRCLYLRHNRAVDESLSPSLMIADAAPASDAYLAQCVQLMSQCAGLGHGVQPAARASAEQAFSVLYDHCVQRVHALVRRFVHDDAVAQEVTEDVFWAAWTHAPHFDAQRGTVLGWLLTMARSRALDAWRQQAAHLVHVDNHTSDEGLDLASADDTPVDLLAAADRQHALHAALAHVSPTARQMLNLAFFQGLTHHEISVHLHLPLGTVKTTIRRALLSLRTSLHSSLGVDMPAGLYNLE
jgi:RNA polymerase sigma factor (sigma-70 family)